MLTKVFFWGIVVIAIISNYNYYKQDGYKKQCESAGGIAYKITNPFIFAEYKDICLNPSAVVELEMEDLK